MSKDEVSEQDVVQMAHIILERALGKNELDATNLVNQVLVAGASVIVAAVNAGLGPEELFALIEANARPVVDAPKVPHLSLVKNENKGGTGFGGYL